MKLGEPTGCWNCRYGEVVGRPLTEYKPGRLYKAVCHAEENPRSAVVLSVTMTAARDDLPVCEWWKPKMAPNDVGKQEREGS